MITVDLVLRVGKLKGKGDLEEYDCFSLETHESVNDCLKNFSELECNYAELWLEMNHCSERFLISSFKKLITKTNDGKKVRWILVD